MHKAETNFTIIASERISSNYQLISLKPEEPSPLVSEIKPGQFVQVKINHSQSTFLRRPISIHDVDIAAQTLYLLVRIAGEGTETLAGLPAKSVVNLIWPLGNGFNIEISSSKKILLAGGGIGVAPLLYLGKQLVSKGISPIFLLAARTAADLLMLDRFRAIGNVALSTDDGSIGEPGLITQNSILREHFDHIYCCGPMPMMKAIAKICRERGIDCEVSLENLMACGIGACLCCVEKTVKGNRCVCTEGPVFNINELTW